MSKKFLLLAGFYFSGNSLRNTIIFSNFFILSFFLNLFHKKIFCKKKNLVSFLKKKKQKVKILVKKIKKTK